jgi:hypothetical protein
MLRCNIKLHANLQPDQYLRKEFIVGSVLDAAVETGHSRKNKGLMNQSIESFMQRQGIYKRAYKMGAELAGTLSC